MVLELVALQLSEVVLRTDHMLDQLCNLLVKLYNIRTLMNKVLDPLPICE